MRGICKARCALEPVERLFLFVFGKVDPIHRRQTPVLPCRPHPTASASGFPAPGMGPAFNQFPRNS